MLSKKIISLTLEFSLFLIFILSAVLCSGCARISTYPLEHATYDMGPEIAYLVRPCKIKLIDNDGALLTFDVISEIELSNPSRKPVAFDMECSFYKENDTLKTRSIKDYKVLPGQSRLVRMVYTTRDYSVNGYMSACKVKIYGMR